MSKYLLIIGLTLIMACDETILIEDVIKLESSDLSVPADGNSLITLTAFPNNESSSSKRSVIFETSNGSFLSNGEKEVAIVAKKLNGILQAKATLKAPTSMGTIDVTAELGIEDIRGQYVASVTINTDSSIVSQIKVTADSFSIANNFDGELMIKGLLRNSQNKGVTQGVSVFFKDVFDDFVTPVNGEFREANLTSNASSKVSVTYSPGLIAEGQFIYLIGTVLERDGNSSGIADTLKLYVK